MKVKRRQSRPSICSGSVPDCERKVRQVRRKPPEQNNLGGIGAVPAIKIIT